MFLLIPVHYFVPWRGSETVAKVAFSLLIVAGASSILGRKFIFLVWALMAMLLHTMVAH